MLKTIITAATLTDYINDLLQLKNTGSRSDSGKIFRCYNARRKARDGFVLAIGIERLRKITAPL